MSKHYLSYPSISKILKATESEEAKANLQRWAESVGMEKAEQIRQSAMERGRVIDANVSEYHVTGDCPNAIIKTYLSPFKIEQIEQDCWSDTHKYFGRFDQLLSKNERIILNDFKGSGKTKQKQWLGDNPVQLSAYFFALLEQGQKVDYAQLSYLVDGKTEVQYFVFAPYELKKYYEEFIERREQYESILRSQITA